MSHDMSTSFAACPARPTHLLSGCHRSYQDGIPTLFHKTHSACGACGACPTGDSTPRGQPRHQQRRLHACVQMGMMMLVAGSLCTRRVRQSPATLAQVCECLQPQRATYTRPFRLAATICTAPQTGAAHQHAPSVSAGKIRLLLTAISQHHNDKLVTSPTTRCIRPREWRCSTDHRRLLVQPHPPPRRSRHGPWQITSGALQ